MTSVDKVPQLMTVEDANNRLPLVKAIVSDITKQAQNLQVKRQRYEEVKGGSESDRVSCEAELSREVERLEDLVDELKQINVELKDPISGHVDFPALVGGRHISLCWILGEEEVGHWHEVNAAYEDRRALLELAGQD